MRTDHLIRNRRIPWGVIGMLALVAIAESFLTRNELDIGATTTSCEWQAIGKALPKKVYGSEILCFGDSLMKMAMSPPLLEQRTGRKAYNLSVSGGRAPSTYFLLRKALDSGIKPAAILVDFKWTALETSLLDTKRTLPDIAGPRDYLDFALTSRNASTFADLMLAEALSSYRCRLELRSSLMAAFQGKSNSLRTGLKPWFRTWNRNRGSHHVPSTPAFNGVINPDDLSVFRKEWHANPINAIYVDRFLKLAADRGIPVYWVVLPVSPNAQAWRDREGVDLAYSAFIQEFERKYENLIVVDGRRSNYPLESFYDTTHLNRRGTAALSAEVANLVRQRLAGKPLADRWVNLPRYREQPAIEPFEDVGESVAAIQKLEQTSRR